MKFNDVKQFKKAIIKYSIVEQRSVDFLRNTKCLHGNIFVPPDSCFFVPRNKKRTEIYLVKLLFSEQFLYFFVPKNRFGTEIRN